VGVGSVQIKAHDGMTRTMQNVRYIPGMSRNLISLSTLDAEGFKYSGSGGVLKVSKGSLVCLVGDMNSAKLYIRQGSILHGSISAIAVVIDDKPCETNFWHMRLGHMSELGMAELMKRNLLKGCTLSGKKLCEHCIFGKHKRESSIPLFIPPKVLLIMYMLTYGVLLVSLLMVVLFTCLLLLMTTLEKYGLTF
jgi:hypothetical protein